MKLVEDKLTIEELINIADEQCENEECRVCVAVADIETMADIFDTMQQSMYVFCNMSLNKLEVKYSNGSRLCVLWVDENACCTRGRRFDYVLMDSRFSDDAKRVIEAMAVRSIYFKLSNMQFEDNRVNAIQEFNI